MRRKVGMPHKGWKKAAQQSLRKDKVTDINFDNIELKNAEVVANVGDKQISAKVEDKADAEKRAEQTEVLPV